MSALFPDRHLVIALALYYLAPNFRSLPVLEQYLKDAKLLKTGIDIF